MWSWARGPAMRRIPQAEQRDPAAARQLGAAEMSGGGSGRGVRDLQVSGRGCRTLHGCPWVREDVTTALAQGFQKQQRENFALFTITL